MQARYPLVLIGGNTHQLPDGDTLAAPAQGLAFEMANASPNTWTIGTPVVIGAQGFQPGQANSVNFAQVVGLILSAEIAPGRSGVVQAYGPLAATANQWAQKTNLNTGLVPGSDYYLSPAQAGRMLSDPPDTRGQFLCYLGRAISSTVLFVNLRPIVGL